MSKNVRSGGRKFGYGKWKPFVLFHTSVFPKRKGLKRLCWPEQSENSLTTEPSGRADTNITHGSFSCQMFNSKSVWRQLVCISFSCREVRTDGAALLLLLLLCPHPSTRLPSFQKLALYFQTDFCCKDLLRNSSCGPANGTEARTADLLSSLGPSQQIRAPKISKLSAIPNPWGLSRARGLCWFLISLQQSDMKVVVGLQKWWGSEMSQMFSPCDAACWLVKLLIYVLWSGGPFICTTVGLLPDFGIRKWRDIGLQMF